MYTSIYLLSQNNDDKSKKYQNRWKTKEGIPLKHHILKALRNDTEEHYLQKEFAEDKLLFLEHDRDLKGLYIEDEEILDRPRNALQEADLSYSYVVSTNFKNLDLSHINFSFASLYNVTFINCVFSYSTFFACYLENVTFLGCDFLERNNIRNCRFTNVRFKHCFVEKNLFHSCCFDEQTTLDPFIHSSRHVKKQVQFHRKELPELYKGIKEGYLAGNVIKKSRDYYFLERQSITRYMVDNTSEKIANYFLEIVAGYGIRPLRVLLWMGILFLLFSLIFTERLGYPDGLLLSTGSYFTNGVDSQVITHIGIGYQLLFILESFLGIVFTTLFITVMANLWFSEK